MKLLNNFWVEHWRIVTVSLLWFCLVYVLRKLGKDLERVNRRGLLYIWLAEIGSDIRLYGVITATFVTLAYAANVYSVYLKWLGHISAITARISIVIWAVLIGIAYIETAIPYYAQIINNSLMNQIDKRNMMTLLPIAGSITKVGVYLAAFVFGLGALGFDITPLINLSTVALAILGFAGAETFKDVLNTLKIFIDRLYYVGSYVELSTDGVCKYDGADTLRGRVTKITLFNTTIELEKSTTHTKLLTVANGVIRSVILYDDIAR